MTGRASQPRIAVVYVQYDRSKYVRSLPRLVALLDTLGAGDAPVVVVDNAAEGDWCHQVSETIVHVGGDNAAWEFSAFDRGLEWLDRERPETEVYLLATDALLAYGEDYLDLLDREVADRRLLASACLGWMDSFCEPCRILDHEYDTWMRTSLLFMPAAAVAGVRPLASPLDDSEIFGESSRQPFRTDAPLSPELRRLLLNWLTIAPDDLSRDKGAGWHSRFVLSEDTFGFFRSKVKSILREHLLSARVRRLGVPCFDFRAARKASDAGLRLAGLGAQESRRWQWLHWFGGVEPPATPGPVLVFDAGSVRERADEAVDFLGREVMPLILQRHAAARLLVRGAELQPGLHSLPDPASVAAAGAGDGSPGHAGAAALLLPGPLSEAAAGHLAAAAAAGVPAVGAAGLEAVAGRHFLPAEKSWELAAACCRLIEDPALGATLAAGARELLGIAANGHGVTAAASGSAATSPPPPPAETTESAGGPAQAEAPRPAFPDGHFYSPVVDPAELREHDDVIWPAEVADNPAVDYRAAAQRELLGAVARYATDFDYPQERPDPARGGFVERNGKFEGLDARMLFCLLRHLRPRRVIEVGSGFSSLLAADVNRRFLGGSTEIVCIEPFPPPFLEQPVEGLTELIERKVQEVPIAVFQRLGEGDVLFIDSSHVAKTGSDVNSLYFRVLPALHAGVVLHVHDVFLPDDYPREWVLGEQRSWSEQYVVHALLTYSHGLEVLFGSAYAARRFPELVRQVFGIDCGGGSLWLRKTVARR
jgi:hypothetical protein